MADSISLEQIQEQQGQLQQTVGQLIAQKATLEDQLENCKATLASNQGALQYANALIQSVTEGTEDVGEGNISEAIEVPEDQGEDITEAVTL
jgi:chromosome segregation ATPase